MSLSSKWKEFRLKCIASDLFGLNPDIQKELEKEGWKFQTETYIGTDVGLPFAACITTAWTPDGKIANYTNTEGRKLYDEARMRVARKIYSPAP